MDRNDIHVFIKALNGVNAIIDDHKDWVNSTCPLARWTHEKGTDNTPSFGISIDSLASSYNCFTCGGGELPELVDRLSRLSGKLYPILEEYIEAEEIGGLVPEWGERGTYTSEVASISEDTIYMYDKVGSHWYLEDRGITADVADMLGLRLDLSEDTRDDRERILFPVYSTLGGALHLVGFTGRATDDDKVLKIRDYYGLKKTEALLGIERVKSEHKFILVVEGLFAYARLSAYGLPAVAIMGSNMSSNQAEMLVGLGIPVYLFFDNDRAGHGAKRKSTKLLEGYTPTYTVKYPRGTENLDPDSLTEYEVLNMIKEAKLI